MSNLDSEEHISIHRYGSEEIAAIIGHRGQIQGSAAQSEFFLFQCIEMKAIMTEFSVESA